MRQIPNDIISTLLRCWPIILENVNQQSGNTRLQNAIRLTNITINKLKKIEKNGKRDTKQAN